jgi:hypothetical protein
MISGAQIRAARALLGMTAAQIAERAQISHRTLQRFEAVDGRPDAQARLLDRVKATFEQMGVVFVGDPMTSPGVQLKRAPESRSERTKRRSLKSRTSTLLRSRRCSVLHGAP